jgi:RIO kinase 1
MPQALYPVVLYLKRREMNTNDYLTLLDELDDSEQIDNFINKSKRREKFPPRHPKKLPKTDQQFVQGQDDSSANFSFTYHASRYEEGWLLTSLGKFYEQKWISDVLRLIKGGKEASVYLCESGLAVEAPLLVVKVYRPRQFRNLKNDALYRVGREELDESGRAITDDGSLHAIRKRTAFGEKLRHQSWIAYEYQALQDLYVAGADVPTPHAMDNNAILMGYIGDVDMAAPPLQSLDLEPAEAKRLFDRSLSNIDLMLAQNRIHGDLSAYNILYWEGEITLIDFPQVVSPEGNPAAWTIFRRDVTRICQYFRSQGVKSDPRKLSADLWTSHGYKIVKQVDPRYLDAENQEDRQVWDRQR